MRRGDEVQWPHSEARCRASGTRCELLTVLLSSPTNDSVEVAIEFVKECGYTLNAVSVEGLHGIFASAFGGILHEGEIDKRVEHLLEGLFAARKAGFEGKKGRAGGAGPRGRGGSDRARALAGR